MATVRDVPDSATALYSNDVYLRILDTKIGGGGSFFFDWETDLFVDLKEMYPKERYPHLENLYVVGWKLGIENVPIRVVSLEFIQTLTHEWFNRSNPEHPIQSNFGYWIDPETGLVSFDKIFQFHNRNAAEAFARQYNQKAIYDVLDNRVIKVVY